MKIILKIKQSNIFILCLLYFTLYGCAPKLTYTEIENRINKDYNAFNDGNVEYEMKNTIKKYLKEYGKDGFRKMIKKRYSNRGNHPYFNVGSIKIQDRNKCNSTYFYNTKYTVDKSEITPYIDSTALKLNYKEYGRENVNFNPNSKILQIRMEKKGILIFDKDRE
ncbi:hypothetical protein, partial [Tenacibaculum haliotis]